MTKATHSLSNRRPPARWMIRLRLLLHYGDRPWNTLTITMAILTILLVMAIGILLWRDSAGSRAAFGLNFLAPTSNASWNPVSGQFQAWPFIYGTLITSLFSLVLAVPISLGAAIFLAELCPDWLRALGWDIRTVGCHTLGDLWFVGNFCVLARFG